MNIKAVFIYPLHAGRVGEKYDVIRDEIKLYSIVHSVKQLYRVPVSLLRKHVLRFERSYAESADGDCKVRTSCFRSFTLS